MAFNKKQSVATQEREKFDLDNSNDLRIVKEFEQELKPYMAKSIEVFGKTLSGFELYLHENGMLRYSKKYPDGAVCFDKLQEYHFAKMKWEALGNLEWRRSEAERHEREELDKMPEATA
jgi:hypothetical protein